jgi:hypothetical protein
MRRTRTASAFEYSGSDSMTDVLANTIGALLLLCISTTMDVGTVRNDFYLTKSEAVSSTPVHFVVKNGTIRQLDSAELLQKINLLGEGEHSLAATDGVPFEVKVTKSNGGSTMVFTESAGKPADAISDCLAGKGGVASAISALNKEQNHVLLWIASDSFEQYPHLRNLCLRQKLGVSWEVWRGTLGTSSGRSGSGGIRLNTIER